jgi:hypothetical protein
MPEVAGQLRTTPHAFVMLKKLCELLVWTQMNSLGKDADDSRAVVKAAELSLSARDLPIGITTCQGHITQ